MSNMALSNWDTLAVNEKGEHSDGVYTSPSGVSVAFYKNWLYISDKSAWDENSGFSEPTIAEMMQGDIRYKDIHIIALRGPKNGVYACIYSGHNDDCTGIVGCGIYGYEGEEWIGVSEESKKFIIEMLSNEDFGIPKTFQNLDLGMAKRFNQGDAFFQKKGIAFGETIETEIGKANEPILHKLLE